MRDLKKNFSRVTGVQNLHNRNMADNSDNTYAIGNMMAQLDEQQFPPHESLPDNLDLSEIQPSQLDVNIDQIDPSIFMNSDEEDRTRDEEEANVTIPEHKDDICNQFSKQYCIPRTPHPSCVGYPSCTSFYHPAMPIQYPFGAPLIPIGMPHHSPQIDCTQAAQYQQVYFGKMIHPEFAYPSHTSVSNASRYRLIYQQEIQETQSGLATVHINKEANVEGRIALTDDASLPCMPASLSVSSDRNSTDRENSVIMPVIDYHDEGLGDDTVKLEDRLSRIDSGFDDTLPDIDDNESNVSNPDDYKMLQNGYNPQHSNLKKVVSAVNAYHAIPAVQAYCHTDETNTDDDDDVVVVKEEDTEGLFNEEIRRPETSRKSKNFLQGFALSYKANDLKFYRHRRKSAKNSANVSSQTYKKSVLLQCSICEYSSYNKSNFRNHLFIHSDERLFACPYCPYKGKQSAGLRAHLKVHSVEKPYKCMYCTYRCKRKQNLVQHLRTHSRFRPFQCRFCSYSTTTKQALQKHSCRHLSLVSENEVSERTTEEGSNLSNESSETIAIVRPASNLAVGTCESFDSSTKIKVECLTCSLCSYKGFNAQELNFHYKTHLEESEVSSTQENNISPKNDFADGCDSTIKCPYCKFTSSRKCAMGNHIKTHDKELYHCPLCSFKSRLLGGFRIHMATHSGKFNCTSCEFKTYNSNLFVSHMKSHKREIKVSGDAKDLELNEEFCSIFYQCPYCAYDCRILSVFKLHVSNHSERDFRSFERPTKPIIGASNLNFDSDHPRASVESTTVQLDNDQEMELASYSVNDTVEPVKSGSRRARRKFERLPNGRFKSTGSKNKKKSKTVANKVCGNLEENEQDKTFLTSDAQMPSNLKSPKSDFDGTTSEFLQSAIADPDGGSKEYNTFESKNGQKRQCDSDESSHGISQVKSQKLLKLNHFAENEINQTKRKSQKKLKHERYESNLTSTPESMKKLITALETVHLEEISKPLNLENTEQISNSAAVDSISYASSVEKLSTDETYLSSNIVLVGNETVEFDLSDREKEIPTSCGSFKDGTISCNSGQLSVKSIDTAEEKTTSVDFPKENVQNKDADDAEFLCETKCLDPSHSGIGYDDSHHLASSPCSNSEAELGPDGVSYSRETEQCETISPDSSVIAGPNNCISYNITCSDSEVVFMSGKGSSEICNENSKLTQNDDRPGEDAKAGLLRNNRTTEENSDGDSKRIAINADATDMDSVTGNDAGKWGGIDNSSVSSINQTLEKHENKQIDLGTHDSADCINTLQEKVDRSCETSLVDNGSYQGSGEKRETVITHIEDADGHEYCNESINEQENNALNHVKNIRNSLKSCEEHAVCSDDSCAVLNDSPVTQGSDFYSSSLIISDLSDKKSETATCEGASYRDSSYCISDCDRKSENSINCCAVNPCQGKIIEFKEETRGAELQTDSVPSIESVVSRMGMECQDKKFDPDFSNSEEVISEVVSIGMYMKSANKTEQCLEIQGESQKKNTVSNELLKPVNQIETAESDIEGVKAAYDDTCEGGYFTRGPKVACLHSESVKCDGQCQPRILNASALGLNNISSEEENTGNLGPSCSNFNARRNNITGSCDFVCKSDNSPLAKTELQIGKKNEKFPQPGSLILERCLTTGYNPYHDVTDQYKELPSATEMLTVPPDTNEQYSCKYSDTLSEGIFQSDRFISRDTFPSCNNSEMNIMELLRSTASYSGPFCEASTTMGQCAPQPAVLGNVDSFYGQIDTVSPVETLFLTESSAYSKHIDSQRIYSCLSSRDSFSSAISTTTATTVSVTRKAGDNRSAEELETCCNSGHEIAGNYEMLDLNGHQFPVNPKFKMAPETESNIQLNCTTTNECSDSDHLKFTSQPLVDKSQMTQESVLACDLDTLHKANLPVYENLNGNQSQHTVSTNTVGHNESSTVWSSSHQRFGVYGISHCIKDKENLLVLAEDSLTRVIDSDSDSEDKLEIVYDAAEGRRWHLMDTSQSNKSTKNHVQNWSSCSNPEITIYDALKENRPSDGHVSPPADVVIDCQPGVSGMQNDLKHNCDMCTKAYTRRSSLLNHMKTHKKALLKCDLCSYACRQRKAYFDHRKLVHGGKLHYNCAHCDYSCTRKSSLMAHSKIHSNKFKCDKCSVTFKSRKELDEHTICHKKYLKCSLCQITCRSSKALYEHSRTAHKKKFRCTECSYKSHTLKELSNHSSLHKKILFRCHKCNYETNSALFLKFHMKKHTKDIKYLSCKECQYVAKSKLDLYNHCSQQHAKQYQCMYCDKIFTGLSAFKDHMTEIHAVERVNI